MKNTKYATSKKTEHQLQCPCVLINNCIDLWVESKFNLNTSHWWEYCRSDKMALNLKSAHLRYSSCFEKFRRQTRGCSLVQHPCQTHTFKRFKCWSLRNCDPAELWCVWIMTHWFICFLCISYYGLIYVFIYLIGSHWSGILCVLFLLLWWRHCVGLKLIMLLLFSMLSSL